MSEDQAEAELWSHARQNDGAAFAGLFDLHKDRVYRRALALLGHSHDADDVTAAAFFELWRRRSSVNLVSGSVLPWLLVTAVNLSRNVRRSTARYQRLLQTAPRSAPSPGVDELVVEADERLATSLRSLSSEDAALLVLTALEGMAISDAAQAVGLTPGAARVRLHRARARLREDLRELSLRPFAPQEGQS